MPERKPSKAFWLPLLLGVSILAAVALSGLGSAQASGYRQETENYCLGCHSNPDLSIALPSGENLSLHISPEMLAGSVHHQAGIECEACHTEIKTFPHPKIDYPTKRDLARAYYEACQKCHPSNYARTMDSIHAEAAERGNQAAPICTDCHGAHDVQPAGEPRSMISTTCGECHATIFGEYQQSIHGSALLAESNPDVPVCTDCHGVHNIQDPRTAQFRVQSPDLCAGCHADAELMSKYGIRSDVYDLYNLSWHGVDISVYQARWPTLWHKDAVCTDCHGTHNMRETSDPASSVNPANLLATCQKCHPGAGPNWTGAWIGHNRIDPQRTPILYLAEQFYSSFVPGVLWLSVLYVALQIIRATVDRIRRSLR